MYNLLKSLLFIGSVGGTKQNTFIYYLRLPQH